jgi:hypothetical protein
VTVECAEGVWDLVITGDGYATYRRSVTVGSGAEVILWPVLVPSAEARQAQNQALQAIRARNQKAREEVLVSAAVAGGAALVGWAAVGGLEALLSTQKGDLADRQAAYRSASAADAPSLWMNVEAQKSTIDASRGYETGALAAATGLSVGALGLWIFGESLP